MTDGPWVGLVWDDRFLEYDFGPAHPFSQKSRRLAVTLAEHAGLVGSKVTRVPAVEPLSRVDLTRFHAAEYVDLVENLDRRGRGEVLDTGDTPSFPGCSAAAARIAGATTLAVQRCAEGSWDRAFLPAGGLHHAARDRASGFCIYNDVAVAIASALDGDPRLSRVAYVDIDVHHGDGVMYGYYTDGRLLDIDFHQDGRTIFPGTGSIEETGKGDGAGLKVNVPLPPRAGDEALIPLFSRIVPPLIRSFRPDLIILQHGVDGHAQDRLGQLQYTDRSYEFVLRTLGALATEISHGRLIVTGGGGYTPETVSRELARVIPRIQDLPGPKAEDRTPKVWQEEFTTAFDQPPPQDWSELGPVLPVDWSPEKEDRIIEELSRALGTTLAPHVDSETGN